MTEYERGFEAGVIAGMKRATFKFRMQRSAQGRRYYLKHREKVLARKRARRAKLREAA